MTYLYQSAEEHRSNLQTPKYQSAEEHRSNLQTPNLYEYALRAKQEPQLHSLLTLCQVDNEYPVFIIYP